MLNLKNATEEQKKIVEQRVKECFAVFYDESLNMSCEIEYSNEMGKVAGYAYPWLNKIVINETLLVENFDRFLIETVPHEVAHLIVAAFYPNAKQNHGPEFRSVCHQMGFPLAAATHHTFCLDSVVKRKTKQLFVYNCACDGLVFKFSKLLHTRMTNGQLRGCTVCRTAVVYTGESITI